MVYYKIKPEYDGAVIGRSRALIANELYTALEFSRAKIPMTCAQRIEIPKTRVYTSFGARFECGTRHGVPI